MNPIAKFMVVVCAAYAAFLWWLGNCLEQTWVINWLALPFALGAILFLILGLWHGRPQSPTKKPHSRRHMGF